MRTVPTTSAMRPTPTPAMSRAMASGTVPSNEKNVTRTGRVFCNMKMTSTINRSANADPDGAGARTWCLHSRSRYTDLRGRGRGCGTVICGLVDRLLGGHHGLLDG
jgi:hypothetical protein